MRSFIEDFEIKRLKFEEKLRGLVLSFFNKKGEATTYDIGKYLIRRSTEFMELKKYSNVMSWYRLRKILESLEKEGELRKELSGMRANGLKFLSYKWTKVVNKL